MSWYVFKKHISGGETDSSSPVIDYFSNVLLQIILPIVLILALIVGTTVVTLRSKSELQTPEELTMAKLQIQKQIIINVIEGVTLEKRKIYNLCILDSLGIIFDNYNELKADTNFIIMCDKIRNDFNSANNIKYQSEKILIEVLNKVKNELTQMETAGIIHDYIDTSNISFASNKVEALVNKLVIDAVHYQNKYLSELLTYYELNMSKISDKRLDELREKYSLASEEDSPTYAKEIYERLIEIIKAHLRSQGIKFLSATWKEY